MTSEPRGLHGSQFTALLDRLFYISEGDSKEKKSEISYIRIQAKMKSSPQLWEKLQVIKLFGK